MYDYKWTLFEKDVKYDQLGKDQIVNHFQKSNHVTTKGGLTRTMKQSHWNTGVNHTNYFPQAFELYLEEDLDEFIEEFKYCKAYSLIIQFINIFTNKKIN